MNSRTIRLLCCLLSGLLLFASFPPLDLFICAWIALVPLFALLWTTPRPVGFRGHTRNFFYGWLTGLIFNGASFWWINEVSTLGFIPAVMYLALYPGLWALLVGGPLRPNRDPLFARDKDAAKGKSAHSEATHSGSTPSLTDRSPAPNFRTRSYSDMLKALFYSTLAACAWVSIEWLRGLGPMAFTWNYLGVASPLQIAQLAEWVGALGLSFLPVLISGILWCSFSRTIHLTLNEGRRTAQWDLLLVLSLVGLAFITGTMLQNRALESLDDPRATNLHLLIVQQNISLAQRFNKDEKSAILSAYFDATRNRITGLIKESFEEHADSPVVPHKPVDWVIWPESTFPWPIYHLEGEEKPTEEQPVADFIDNYWLPFSESEGPFNLITGADEAYFDPESLKLTRIYNSLRSFDDSFSKADPWGIYEKRHLVPFGEYIPLRKTLPILEKAFAISAGMTMGSNYSEGTQGGMCVYSPKLGEIHAIATICFEDTLPHLIRSDVDNKFPEVILNVTNDGWFNQSVAAEQHFRNARFRAIELRRPLIRAANTGVSCIVQVDGSTRSPQTGEIYELRDADGKTFFPGTLYGKLVVRRHGLFTIFHYFGDWFAYCCIAFTLFGLTLPLLRSRYKHHTKQNSPPLNLKLSQNSENIVAHT